ncbi:cation:dicarboxylate symporter family transporter, partial [Bacillus cereus]|uniref:cation:dicarboxylate symporter family transporter n=1 Tax=Bacillus cereus TaxID=1396 RepID=UPI0021110207
GKTNLYFENITTNAILMGLLAAKIYQPGSGVDMSNLQQSDISTYKQTADATEKKGFAETNVHIVPKNVFQSIALGDL